MANDALVVPFRFGWSALERNLDGLSEAEALRHPEPAGNCANWLVGHLLAYRDRTHQLLGLSPAWPDYFGDPGTYKRGGDGTLDAPRTLEEMLTAFRASQELVIPALEALSIERLAEPASNSQTVAGQLGFLAFHEGYHAGQAGLLRRLLGKPGAI